MVDYYQCACSLAATHIRPRAWRLVDAVCAIRSDAALRHGRAGPRWSRSASSATSGGCRPPARRSAWPASTSVCTAPTARASRQAHPPRLSPAALGALWGRPLSACRPSGARRQLRADDSSPLFTGSSGWEW